jgi:hypothetical protein
MARRLFAVDEGMSEYWQKASWNSSHAARWGGLVRVASNLGEGRLGSALMLF